MLYSPKPRLRTITKCLVVVFIGVLLLMLSAVVAYVASEAVSVDVGPAYVQPVSPGQIVAYEHVLTNTGTLTDTFVIDVVSTQGWPVELIGGSYPSGTVLLPVIVGPQDTFPFQVNLTVPSDINGAREVTYITATSQMSPTVFAVTTDTSIVTGYLHLPFVSRLYPLLPKPSLNAIQNEDYGAYTVSWEELPSRMADLYTLEEATNAAFTENLRTVCNTAGLTCEVSDKLVGTYYYRVRGKNSSGFGPWSNVQGATVLVPDVFHLAFYDDFSNPATGWPNGDTSFGSAYYDGGEYHLVRTGSPYYLFAGVSPDLAFSNDVLVKVQARIEQSDNQYTYGKVSLVFGLDFWEAPMDDVWRSWYQFQIVPAIQHYSLRKWFGTAANYEIVDVLAQGTSEAILSEKNVMQTLEIQRSGDSIALLVNGIAIDNCTDNDNPYTGQRFVGVGAGDFYEVVFDNFEVHSKARP